MGIDDQFGPDDDRSWGLSVGQAVRIRTTSGADHEGTVAGIGLHLLDIHTSSPETGAGRCRIRLSAIESLTWLEPREAGR